VTADPLHMVLLRLVYDDLVQLKLNEFVHWWNTHPIRFQASAAAHSPHGVPDNLFDNPESFVGHEGPGQAFGIPVVEADLDACDQFVTDYESKRVEVPRRGDPSRITRGDLSHYAVPDLRRILSQLGRPTMRSANSIYRVALYTYKQEQDQVQSSLSIAPPRSLDIPKRRRGQDSE